MTPPPPAPMGAPPLSARALRTDGRETWSQ